MTARQLAIFSLILLFLLILRFIYVFRFEKGINLLEGDSIAYVTTLNQEPKTSSGYQFFQTEVGNRRIGVLTSAFPQFYYGDKLKIKGKISSQKTQLPNKGLQDRFVLYFPKIEAEKNTSILAVVSSIRQKLISNFSETLSFSGSSLLLGIVFGIREAMPKEFLEQLRLTGVMHVIAASGMNVTMVAGFLTSLTVLFFKRKTALVISMLGILFYATLAGLQPSIVRASIMAIIVFSAQILGRQATAGYSLFLTAIFMLFLSPREIFDIGFQLSFLSTAGILYIQPLFTRPSPRLRRASRFFQKSVLGESIITTFSAQVSTLPILLLNFGSYSIWSIIVNAAVLWTIPPLMVLGGIAGIFSFIFTPISKLILFICLPFLMYFEKVVSLFSNLPGTLQLSNFSPLFALGYYFFLASLLIYFKKRRLNA